VPKYYNCQLPDMYYIKNLLLIMLLAPVVASSADIEAQDAISQLRGMRKEEVISYIGPPTRTSNVNTQSQSETLFYGQSQILLVGGSVISWSDTGELGTRLRHFSPPPKSSWKKWPNPWTPPASMQFDETVVPLPSSD
jgi:hypothetical protein